MSKKRWTCSCGRDVPKLEFEFCRRKPCSVCKKRLCGHELLLVDSADSSPNRVVICEPCKYQMFRRRSAHSQQKRSQPTGASR